MMEGIMLRKGAFVISIDHEFAWGYADVALRERDRIRIRGEYKIGERLLNLFERYRTPATWAVVGHLLERKCTWKNSTPHPEYPRPLQTRGGRDWFFQHPPEGAHTDSLWYDTDSFFEQVVSSPVGHEIASHSYAHIIYNAPNVSEDAVRADLANVIRIHRERGIPATSFVFPRNGERHHRLLREHGFTCFRGSLFPQYGSLPKLLRFFGKGAYFLPVPKLVSPSVHSSGLVNIPSSMMLVERRGVRKLVFPSLMKLHMRLNLRAAARKKKMFHLWFHLSNFSYATDIQFSILETALAEAKKLRERGLLDVVTMRELCNQARR